VKEMLGLFVKNKNENFWTELSFKLIGGRKRIELILFLIIIYGDLTL